MRPASQAARGWCRSGAASSIVASELIGCGGRPRIIPTRVQFRVVRLSRLSQRWLQLHMGMHL